MGRGSVGRKATVVLGVVALVAAVACAPVQGRQAGWRGEHLSVPAIPLPGARSFAVDTGLLERLACDACGGLRPPSDPHFFYGTLALGSVDALFAGDAAPGGSWLGNLFLSGWFGGLFLKQSLTSSPLASPAVAPAPMASPDVQEALLGALRGGTFGGLDTTVADLLRTAAVGPAEAVRAAAAPLLLLMTLVHGYNRGYLEVVLEHPPEGVVAFPPLRCGEWLGCRTDELPLRALDALEPVAHRLATSAEPSWRLTADALAAVDRTAVPAGRAVWSGLLGTEGFDAAGYGVVVELSYGFLEVTEAAVLALGEGALGDVAVGRRGLVLTAGLLLWAGSYLLGLTGEVGPAGLPTLECG